MKQTLTILLVLYSSILLNAQEEIYTHADMVGSYRVGKNRPELHLLPDSTFVYVETNSYKRKGKWEVKQTAILLYFDEREKHPLEGGSPMDWIKFKELRIVGKNKIAWPYTRPFIMLPWDTTDISHHESYLVRFKMKKCDKARIQSGSSRKRKGKKEVILLQGYDQHDKQEQAEKTPTLKNKYMGTFSFITEFKGNVYLRCYQSEDSQDAFRQWVNDFASQPYVSRMQQKQIVEDSLDEDLAPILLKDIAGKVWCWWIFPWGKSLLVNFMETVEWEEETSHTYTYIALYDGGTYVSQHSGIDYNDSTMRWLEYFIRTPYLNDSQKEILSSNFARHLSSSIEESCNFRILHITLCDKQLDLYIAKTKVDDNVKIRSNDK